MLAQFFIILLVGAVGSLVLGLKMKKWLLTMFATILFLTLAFQAFSIEVVTGGVTLQFTEIIIVLLMWFGGFASFMATLYGAINHYRNRDSKKNTPPVPWGGY